MTIKKARIEDYEAVEHLYSELHNYHACNRNDFYKKTLKVMSLSEYSELLHCENRQLRLALCDKGSVLGLVEFEKRYREEDEKMQRVSMVFINALITHPDKKRHGVARFLFNSVVKYGKATGAGSVELNVWNFNHDAIAFYNSMDMKVKNIRYETVL